MKWLLTGCSGFIANNIVDYFSEIEIVGVDLLSNPQIKTIIQDIAQPVKGDYDLIIHAASGYQDDLAMFNANFLGTKRCIETANRSGCPIIYISSAEAYQPVRTYGIMKLAGEYLIKTYTKGYIVRPFHIYGPKMNLDDGRVQSQMLRSIRYNEVFKMRGDGKSIRSFTHVDDLCFALSIILKRGCPGMVYDVTNEFESNSIEDICRSLNISYTLGVEAHPIKCSVGDSSPLRSLGWVPAIRTIPGFIETSKTYK